MAMQICVLTDERIDSVAEWQKAVEGEGFALQLSDADAKRNLVARLGDEETEIEYGVYTFAELKEAFGDVNFRRNWKYAVGFTWSSNFAEEIAAWMAATAYARVTNGVIFDEQEGKLFTPDESVEVTREIERRRPEMEAILSNYVNELAAKSPEAEAALRTFMQRRSTKTMKPS